MTAGMDKTQVFNRPDCFIPGWYWALRSRELKPGQVKSVTLMGRDLALFRPKTGKVVAMDAYCPHMGAHLAEGRVEGNCIRCFFHNWKFDQHGACVEVPSLEKALPVTVTTWQTEEAYGMIWVWTGKGSPQQLPFVPELEHEVCDSAFGAKFQKNCHPNVVMINAIDAHHFNTVHRLPLKIVFEKQLLNPDAITFSNTTRGGNDSWLIRLIRPLYENEVTYKMCYWYGSIGTVTVGPDFLHFHIMFALRMTEAGRTEGQTILITKQRSRWWGWALNRLVLWLTQQVGNYFAKGDTQVFQTIQFDLKTPTKADRSILEFIEQIEQRSAIAWKSWEPLEDCQKPIEQKVAAPTCSNSIALKSV